MTQCRWSPLKCCPTITQILEIIFTDCAMSSCGKHRSVLDRIVAHDVGPRTQKDRASHVCGQQARPRRSGLLTCCHDAAAVHVSTEVTAAPLSCGRSVGQSCDTVNLPSMPQLLAAWLPPLQVKIPGKPGLMCARHLRPIDVKAHQMLRAVHNEDASARMAVACRL